MKKTLALLCALCFVCTCFFSCSIAPTEYTILEMKSTGAEVNTALLDAYFSNNENYSSSYEIIKRNNPDILSNAMNVTPPALSGFCEIYRFVYETGSRFDDNTYLVYEGKVYPLGGSFGGHGVTEFAYAQNGKRNYLYFIYSCGSGIHRSVVGVFDFQSKSIKESEQIFVASEQGNDMGDISFTLAPGVNTALSVCKAKISMDYRTLEISITDAELLYENVENILEI